MTTDKSVPDELSLKTMQRLREVLDEPYHLSRDATIFSEIATGEFNYTGMSELRDALEHINRAISSDNEKEAMSDLDSAFEHIRRSGVESVQKAATKLYFDVSEAMNSPSLAIRLSGLKVPDQGEVRKMRMRIMKNIVDGRAQKADRGKWKDSIRSFVEAINLSIELKDMFPPKGEIRFRLFTIACGVVTIVSLVIAVVVMLT
jgi:hypothetical protein